MRRVGWVLLLLSTISLVDGGLLRPCHCHDRGARPCGSCLMAATEAASRALARAPCCPCCRTEDPAGGTVHGLRAPRHAPDGFHICPGPRDPRQTPEVSFTLAAPRLCDLQAVASWVLPRPARSHAPAEALGALPRDGPWRLAPEGLAVFLT
jgi:hypothetical protein